jgi:hypothetical protein
LAIGREVTFTPFRSDDDDLTLADSWQGYFTILELAIAELILPIPKVLPLTE